MVRTNVLSSLFFVVIYRGAGRLRGIPLQPRR
jgi:hypothetical protein